MYFKPQSKRQEKFAEMIIMNVDTPVLFSYFTQVKMLVGVTKQKKIQTFFIPQAFEKTFFIFAHS